MITNIVFIRTEKILPHKDNPRSAIGDINEIADSIKVNGIMQNLTVVPNDTELYTKQRASKKAYTGDYTVIIGHRRLAAAKQAGLDTVPCVVSDMDLRQQVSTMLLENMQRSDLTILEQANGFQMMLNLGESVSDIREKTGFSTSTIKRRISLLDLDKEKFEQSVGRGATLDDFAQLDKIKDIERRNSVLETIGTPNFNHSFKKALSDQQWKKDKKKLISFLQEFATEVDTQENMRSVSWVCSWHDNHTMKKPEDIGDTEYFYFINGSGNAIYLLKKDDEKTKLTPQEIERQRLNALRNELDAVNTRAYELRHDYIKNFTAAKRYAAEIMEFAAQAMIFCGWRSFDKNLFYKRLGIDKADFETNDLPDTSRILKETDISVERMLLIAAYCNNADGDEDKYYDHQCNHKENTKLDRLYNFLVKIGYQISDEEQTMRDGTHELFSEV